jgi:hypothetical protein
MLGAWEGHTSLIIIRSYFRKRWMAPRVESRYGEGILQLRPAITPTCTARVQDARREIPASSAVQRPLWT